MTEEQILTNANLLTTGAADILSNLISRYASHKAKDSAFTDQRALLQTIDEIASLRAKVKELRYRNARLLSQMQETEVRDINRAMFEGEG
jgi:hypothetical protein